MQTVEEQLETIHLYVVREEEQEKRPYTLLPLDGAFLCFVAIIAVTVYSADHLYYEHETLRIPAQFLPLKTFTTTEPIIPTGIKTYPATHAAGTLTITNGSILSGELPKGMIVTGSNGVEVVTDTAVFIPAGSADGYGVATVSAHAVIGGALGNIPAYQIDSVESSSIYIRNLSPFTGGSDSYSVKVVTPQDRQIAMDTATAFLAAQKAPIRAILAKPCTESVVWSQALRLAWRCQFVAYPILSGMKITAVRLVGTNLFVDVLFVPRPRIIAVK